MAESTPKSYHTDPTLYLYTSLTAGSSHIITATSRLETILKANKIPFRALDVATDEKARMLWGRRAGKRKLPGLVRMGMIVGDLEEVEEWNEYGELKEHISPGAASPAVATPSPTPSTPSKIAPLVETPSKVRFTADPPTKTTGSTATGSPLTLAMRQAGAEAAKKASEAKSQSRAKHLGVSQASNGTAKKSDNSTAPESPSQSNITDEASAIPPEIDSTTKSTADDAKATQVLTKLSEDSGSPGKGDSSSDRIIQSAPQDLPDADEASGQERSSDKPSQVIDQGLKGGEDSESRISAGQATDQDKLKTEEQEVIETVEGGRVSESDDSKPKTVKVSTDGTQAD